MQRAAALILLIFIVACGKAASSTPAPHPLADAYRAPAARILEAARGDDGAYKKLAFLTDRIGNRLSGSAALERAVAWAVDAMKADGHDVRTDPVQVPHWVRHQESAELTAPIAAPLHILGLGGASATPPGGIEAPIVRVTSFEALDALGPDAVKGKIVFFDHPMQGTHYDEAVAYRNNGPTRASRMGAAAALVRTVTAHSLRSPHTGHTRFDETSPAIPAAAISIEDAELIARLVAAGDTVTVHLTMGAETLPPAPSANVIGELRGREHPDEVVLIGAHIDSWDVGQGAHDDGAGCVTVMQALTVLRRLDLVPRRTIRVVLFTNEENGLAGARDYFRTHAAELPQHVAALESDSGGFAPVGFQVHVLGRGRDETIAQVADIAGLLAPIHATKVEAGFGGTDAEESTGDYVPQIGLDVDESTYFDYHHSQADTLDKVDPEKLRDDVAAMAVMAYVLADMPERLASRSR
jgi:hypothetical protein